MSNVCSVVGRGGRVRERGEGRGREREGERVRERVQERVRNISANTLDIPLKVCVEFTHRFRKRRKRRPGRGDTMSRITVKVSADRVQSGDHIYRSSTARQPVNVVAVRRYADDTVGVFVVVAGKQQEWTYFSHEPVRVVL